MRRSWRGREGGADPRRQRTAGIVAILLAAAYVVAMPYFLLVVGYPDLTDAVDKVDAIVAHQGSMQAVYLLTYVLFGIGLAFVALALFSRFREGAPTLGLAGLVVGLLWAVALVASGLIFNAGMAAVVDLQADDPAQAVSTWQAIEPVAQGLGGSGGELLGGLWVLLVSVAALVARRLPKALNWLGLAIGAAGIISVVPALNDVAYGFGLLQIVWFVWLGVVLVRTPSRPTGPARDTEVREPTTSVLAPSTV